MTNDIITNTTEITNINCEECGCVDVELFELDGQLLCEDCAIANGYIRCDDCGEWMRESDCYTTVSGECICPDCYRSGDYVVCEDCGDVIRREDAITVNNGYRDEMQVCESCADAYYRCDNCGEYFTDFRVHRDAHEGVVCDECYDRRWYICEDCGRLINTDEAEYRNGDYYCEDCVGNCGSAHFHDYSYKPTPEFCFRSSELEKLRILRNRYISGYEAQTDVLTFGVELEVDDGDDHNELCDELAALDQPIYMKHDGSLGDEGVEIVTHPCSLAYHQYELRWAEISRICKANGYTSHDAVTCGLHVHVGRAALGADNTDRAYTIAKLVWLVLRLKDDLTKFSRRGINELNHWAKFPMLPSPVMLAPDGLLTKYALETVADGRYQAINLCPDATVEFRLFRGTLKRDTLIATLQLVNNLVKYAMTHTIEECALSAVWSDVLAVEQFKELNTYAAKRGLK